MQISDLGWTGNGLIQHALLAIGILLSFALWYSTWKRITNFWSICWRVYLTVVLTAGMPWYGNGKPCYILYWTLLFEPERYVFSVSSIVAFIVMTVIYWVGYMLVAVPIVTFIEWFNE
jgi:hypothetical protein